MWRILFSTTGKIVGESRTEENKQATFFCLDEETGSALWENVRLEEPWWVGIESLYSDILFLHEFEKPDLPEHKKIRAVDLKSGKELWRNDELTFWFVFRDRVYAYGNCFDRRAGYVLDAHSGKVLESHEDGVEPLSALRVLAQEENGQEGFKFPEVYDVADAETGVQALISATTKSRNVFGAIEYLVSGDYLLMNYHAPARSSRPDAPSLENRLHVFEYPKGRPVLSEVLVSEAAAPTPDSFFLKNDMLFFIKNRHVLTAVRLENRDHS